ncbi:reverse transcriptase domain-containing protein [Aeromonas fluvialis]|uniref:reverse transcriptase domain-containing protein n=1 Tax=Aeromonas fluvialis TaxID=591962 RepID=UPI0005A916B5
MNAGDEQNSSRAEQERRGHHVCRYADDCNLYVGHSRKAGEHLLKEISEFLERKLKLQVNVQKIAVARPWERKSLGYSVTEHKTTKWLCACAPLPWAT